MSIEKIYPEDIETFSLDLFPKFVYESSSSGITGSAYVYARRSARLKDSNKDNAYSGSIYDESDLKLYFDMARRQAETLGSNNSAISEYLGVINSRPYARRQDQKVEMLRLTPTFDIDETFNKKTNILKNIYGYARYSNTHFAFTNYNSLNFFTSSTVNNNAVLIYPNSCSAGSNGIISGAYVPNSGFTFDFWVNPRYSTDAAGATFKAGTILHLSGVFAVSLMTGSGRDPDNIPNDFRIILQVSGGAFNAPSNINASSPPSFCFVSTDGSLKRNRWHHVSVRWGGNNIANGSGSIVINNTVDSYFNLPYNSIVSLSSSNFASPNALMVGNFYEGTNAGANRLSRFFSSDVATFEGLDNLDSATTGYTEPTAYTFNHPLNAEISDLKIYNDYLSNSEINELSSSSPLKTESKLIFYLPAFFTPNAPTRTYDGTNGGILQTPFYAKTGTTTKPTSADLSFEAGIHYVNLQNFTKEFVRDKFPRLLNLTASKTSLPSPMPATGNDIMYSTSSVRKSSLTVMPCDNGSFVPKFKTWLSQSTISTASFKNDLDITDYSFVTNRNAWEGNYWRGIFTDTLLEDITGPYPEQSSSFSKAPSFVSTVYQRTRNADSQQFVFFDISNLFYGKRIHPGSLEMIDTNMSCSGGKVSIKLRDDGFGNIYRADNSENVHATWSSVGNVFYDEGLVVLKHPSLYFFGKSQYKITLQGEQAVHTTKINCYMRPLMETSSSNPSYQKVDINTNANDPNKDFVYVTEVLIHDDNLNVIGRAKLAQPYMKKTSNKTLVKFVMDY